VAQDRLDGLSLLAVERDAAQKLDIIDKFAKLESQNSIRTLFTRDYVLTCESVHVITCCMMPCSRFCVLTVIEFTVIY